MDLPLFKRCEKLFSTLLPFLEEGIPKTSHQRLSYYARIKSQFREFDPFPTNDIASWKAGREMLFTHKRFPSLDLLTLTALLELVAHEISENDKNLRILVHSKSLFNLLVETKQRVYNGYFLGKKIYSLYTNGTFEVFIEGVNWLSPGKALSERSLFGTAQTLEEREELLQQIISDKQYFDRCSNCNVLQAVEQLDVEGKCELCVIRLGGEQTVY